MLVFLRYLHPLERSGPYFIKYGQGSVKRLIKDEQELKRDIFKSVFRLLGAGLVVLRRLAGVNKPIDSCYAPFNERVDAEFTIHLASNEKTIEKYFDALYAINKQIHALLHEANEIRLSGPPYDAVVLLDWANTCTQYLHARTKSIGLTCPSSGICNAR